MDLEAVRKHCLSLPHATENVQWGADLVFKIGGKMFAVAVLEPGYRTQLSFKCAPEEFAELIERPGIIPAPYLARAHWVALERYDALPDAQLRRLLRDSYEMVLGKLPAKVRTRLARSRRPRSVR